MENNYIRAYFLLHNSVKKAVKDLGELAISLDGTQAFYEVTRLYLELDKRKRGRNL